jgi:hypothetical protein
MLLAFAIPSFVGWAFTYYVAKMSLILGAGNLS